MFNIQLLLNLFKFPNRVTKARNKVAKSMSMFVKAHKSIEKANDILLADIAAKNAKLSQLVDTRRLLSSEISSNFNSVVENRTLQDKLKRFIPPAE